MDLILVFIKLLTFLVIVLSNYLYNYLNNESIKCSNGYFRINSMKNCHQILDCSDFDDMTPIVFLSRGLVKKIYLYEWNDNYLVVSKLSQQKYTNDFMHTIDVLRQLSPNDLMVQLIGWCENHLLFTEYHGYGDATRLPLILSEQQINANISLKFQFCVNYVKIIDLLHNSPIGTRVMCDSNSLQKTLSQFLVTTNLSLVLNDLDALPQVTPQTGIKCGSRQLFGTFVAPEQLWPFSNESFDVQKMPEYDHKSDIWKIPDVCQWFLSLGSNDSESVFIANQLKDIDNQCKSFDPKERPSTKQILNVYKQIESLISNELKV